MMQFLKLYKYFIMIVICSEQSFDVVFIFCFRTISNGWSKIGGNNVWSSIRICRKWKTSGAILQPSLPIELPQEHKVFLQISSQVRINVKLKFCQSVKKFFIVKIFCIFCNWKCSARTKFAIRQMTFPSKNNHLMDYFGPFRLLISHNGIVKLHKADAKA